MGRPRGPLGGWPRGRPQPPPSRPVSSSLICEKISYLTRDLRRAGWPGAGQIQSLMGACNIPLLRSTTEYVRVGFWPAQEVGSTTLSTPVQVVVPMGASGLTLARALESVLRNQPNGRSSGHLAQERGIARHGCALSPELSLARERGWCSSTREPGGAARATPAAFSCRRLLSGFPFAAVCPSANAGSSTAALYVCIHIQRRRPMCRPRPGGWWQRSQVLRSTE